MATGVVGAKIVLEGEAQYRKALRDIRTEQSELRSEMKLAQSEYSKAQNSMDALAKKHEILSKQVEASAKKVAVYEKALQTSTEKEQKSKQKVDELTKTLAKLEAEQKSMANSSETSAEALKEQEEAIEEARTQLERANKDYDTAVETTKKYQTQLNMAQAEMNGFNDALKENDKYLEEAEKSSDNCATSIDELGKQTKETETEVGTFGDVLKANLASEVIISALKSLVKGIKDVATACIESGMAFEASMSNVAALSGATNDELDIMAKKAKELGASTIFSASEVADAMSYMALAGWDTASTIAGIEPVLNLAAAASMDLAQASDIVTDYLTAFGLTAQDAEHFTNQLAYAMANSNTTVELLGESYKNVAATAASLGYSVEDVTGALMTMANAGVKGGEAGTSLRAIMINLATNTNDCANALHEFGVEIYDSTTGEMRNLSDILVDTAVAFEGLGDSEANALSKTIAGKTQYTGFQTLMLGLSDAAKDAGMSMTDYADALNDVDGYAKNMASTMQDNLKGKLTALGSAMEGLKIASYELFDDALKDGVDGATDAVSRLTSSVSSGSLNTSLSKLATLSGELIDKIVKWSEENLPKLVDGLAEVLEHSEDIGAALKTVITTFVALKTSSATVSVITGAMKLFAMATADATKKQVALNAATNANPYIKLAGAFAGLVVATVAFSAQAIKTIEDMHSMSDESRILVENTESLTKSLENEAKARNESRKAIETQADVALDLVDSLEQMQKEYANGADNMLQMRNVVDQLNQIYPDLNLELDEHTGLTNLDTQAIRENINEALRSAKVKAAEEDLLEIAKEQYETEKRIKDIEEQRAKKEAEKDALMQKMTKHQEEYNKAIENGTAVFEDGDMASADYANRIQDLDKEINELSNSIETEKGNLESLGDEYADVTGYIEENTAVVEESKGAYDELNESLDTSVTLSETAGKAISEMYDSVSDSIKGQIDLFKEWQEGDKVATETLEKNLDSQITALESWAENMGILSERGIDENLYAKLAQMGPEGASYVAAFVSMSEEELQGYGEKFAAALKLEDSVAEQITTDYAEVSGYILDGMALGLEDDEVVTAAIGTVAEDAYKAWMEANDINSPSKLYEEISEYIPEGMAEGIKKKSNNVTNEIKLLSENASNMAKDKLKKSEFVRVGEEIDEGIIQGIENKEGDVYKKVKEMCEGILNTTEETLDINSPSKKFRYFGEMSGEGYELGLEESMQGIGSIINGAMSAAGATGRIASRGTSPIEQIASMISEYLPEIANNDTNVNVSLEGDARGLFNAVQKQNNVFKKTTGRSAFA